MSRSLGEVDFNPHGWLWRLHDFGKEIAIDVVEMASELEVEVEPEDVTELLHYHSKTWMDEELLLRWATKVISWDGI